MKATRTALASLCCGLLSSACGGGFGSVADAPSAGLAERDFATQWTRLPPPAPESTGWIESLIETPAGYAALYRKGLGEAKVVAGWENHVFLSKDGVHWVGHPIPLAEPSEFYRGLAYGADRYVLVGARYADVGIFATSQDGKTWQRLSQPADALHAVEFANGRFFAMSLGQGIWSSRDGSSWSRSATHALQVSDVAYGAGRFVAVGSGPFEVSSDGTSWHPVSLDCSIAGNCISDPSGNWHQSAKFSIFFAEGTFYADRFVSNDGAKWRQIGDASSIPHGYYSGYLLRLEDDETLVAWRGRGPRRKVSVKTMNTGEANCRTHRCFILGKQLFLIPGAL